jgi:hypothetical protein
MAKDTLVPQSEKSLSTIRWQGFLARIIKRKSVVCTGAGLIITYGSKFLDFGTRVIDWLQRYDYIANRNTKSYQLLQFLFSPRGADFLFFIFLIAFVLAVMLAINPKERQPASPDGEVPSDAEHARIIEQKDSRIIELEGENSALKTAKKSLESDLGALKWLKELADRDKSNIGRYVYILFRKIKYEGLDELDPYIEIIFDIINASVYDITIDKNILSGAVYFNSLKLNPKQTEILGSIQNISREDRGEGRLLVIQQWFPNKDVAERIRKPQPGDVLRFNTLSLTVNAGDGNPEVRSQRLTLPDVPIIRTTDELTADYTSRLNELNAAYESHARKIKLLSEVLGRANEIDYIFSQQDEIPYPPLGTLAGLISAALTDCYGQSADDRFYRGNLEFKRVPDSGRDDWLQAHRSRLLELIMEEEAQLVAHRDEIPRQ